MLWLAIALGLATLPAAVQEGAAVDGERERAAAALEARLKGHAFLKKLPLESVDGFEPLLVAVQKPYGAQPGWQTFPSNRFAPWVRELIAVFDALYVEPLQLRPVEGFGPPSLAVLATAGDLLNFQRAPGVAARSSGYGSALYSHDLDLLVCTAESTTRAPHLERFPVLFLAAQRMLRAYGHGARDEAGSLWLNWGLPAYLAHNLGFAPESLRTRELDRDMLLEWIEEGQRARQRGGSLLPLADLIAARSPEDLTASVGARAAALREPAPDAGAARRLGYSGACLWMHFLQDGAEGRHRDGFQAYLGGALAGLAADRPAFELALQLDEDGLAELEREFEAYLIERGVALDLIHAARPPGVEGQPEPEPAVVVRVPVEVLLPGEGDADMRHGLALSQALRGDLAGAVATLEELERTAAGSATYGRMQRDLERARAFRELRDLYLAELAVSGERLTIEREGKRLNLRIASVEADHVVLRETRGGLDALPLAELDSLAVARQMGRRIGERETGWVRYWPYALADDERWRDQLDTDDATQRALHDDAAEWYPGALRLGQATRALIDLAELPPPLTPEASRRVLADLEVLLAEFGELDVVAARRAALRDLATGALETGWSEAADLAELHGAVEPLGEGRVRLTYAFDADEELSDFRLEGAYPPSLVGRMNALTSKGAQSGMKLRRGGYGGAGSLSLRHRMAFEAPLQVVLRLSVGGVPDDGIPQVAWLLGACDDGQSSFLVLEGLGSLYVSNRHTDHWDSVLAEAHQQLDFRTYRIELRHDGQSVLGSIDGDETRALAVAGRTRGDVFVAMHSDAPLTLEELTIEGLPSPSLNRMRWVAARLAELGLSEP